MSEKRGSYTTRKFHDPIDDVLDRPIAFNPAFKKITGSTVAALMLSQAWYWSKRTSDEDGWFYKTIAEWEDETGLTRSEQETARKNLKGILDVELRGVPATLYYKVNKPKILELLGVQFAETLQTSLRQPYKLDSGNPANINRTESTTENTQRKGDLIDGMLHFGKLAQSQEEDKIEEIITALERGLKVNIGRTLTNQQVAKRILKDGRPLETWLSWVKSDEWRAARLYIYADLERVWRDYPQAFGGDDGMNPQGLEVGV
jgi:hypothetical protein